VTLSELRHRLKRLSWRVPIIVVAYLAPTFAGMSEEAAKPYREACVGALVIALGAWTAKQGQRKTPRDGEQA